jgi:hypothetical protein
VAVAYEDGPNGFGLARLLDAAGVFLAYVTPHARAVLATELPFLWHPFLHHYGTNAAVPDEGPYRVSVRIAPAGFVRHDPVNGRRYAEPVEAHFENVGLTIGRKPSPDAEPRGAEAPTAFGV